MTILKQLLNFYINSSIHVALAVVALTWVTFFQFDLVFDYCLFYFVFFATITGYNFIKYFGVARFHHRSLANWLKTIQVFSFLAFIAMCYFAFQLELNSLSYLVLFGLITFFYAMPVWPWYYFKDQQKNLRQVGGLKIYVIAIVWVFVTLFLPLIEYKISINTDTILTAAQRFLMVIVLTLPFEIRDLNYDSIKLATIPQRIGIKNTKIFGVALLILFFLMEYFKDDLRDMAILSNVMLMIITLLFLLMSNKNQSKYYSAFWVEAIPIMWIGILLMLG